MATVGERVKTIISEHLGVQESEVTNEASIVADLGADSLDSAELLMALAEEFKITIPDEDVDQIVTVGAAVDYIQKRSKLVSPVTDSPKNDRAAGKRQGSTSHLGH